MLTRAMTCKMCLFLALRCCKPNWWLERKQVLDLLVHTRASLLGLGPLTVTDEKARFFLSLGSLGFNSFLLFLGRASAHREVEPFIDICY